MKHLVRKAVAKSSARKTLMFGAVLIVMLVVSGPVQVVAQAQALTVEQAVKLALDNSSELRGATWELRSAHAQALAAKLKMIPSISLGGTYTHLSDTPAETLNIPAFPPYLSSSQSFTLPPNFFNQTDDYSFVVRLEYPVFAGFRLREATKIAQLKSTSRAYAVEITERAIIFEVRRAYWEILRADAGAAMLAKNLSVVDALRQDVRAQQSQGLATESDLMNADQQYDDALLSLADASGRRNSAYLALASILGQDAAGNTIFEAAAQDTSNESQSPYQLVSDPAAVPAWAAVPPGDLGHVVSQALANRAETQVSALSAEIAEHAVNVAKAGIYPTLSLFGDYIYADPNSRIMVSEFDLTPGFWGTWEVGVQLKYELGALPTTLAQGQAAEADAQKAHSEATKQADAIVLDVRAAMLALRRAHMSLETVSGMVKQVEENLRVVQDKQHNGVARLSDVLSAQLLLVRSQYAVTSREIDLQIAAADFARAAAMDPLARQE